MMQQTRMDGSTESGVVHVFGARVDRNGTAEARPRNLRYVRTPIPYPDLLVNRQRRPIDNSAVMQLNHLLMH